MRFDVDNFDMLIEITNILAHIFYKVDMFLERYLIELILRIVFCVIDLNKYGPCYINY